MTSQVLESDKELGTLKAHKSGTSITCDFCNRELDVERAMRVKIAISIALKP